MLIAKALLCKPSTRRGSSDIETNSQSARSYDHGRVGYTANSELGTFEPKFVVAGTGLILSGSDDFNPRVLTTTNDYFGAYFTDTFEITDQLALTVGGRYNWARIEIEDDTGRRSIPQWSQPL